MTRGRPKNDERQVTMDAPDYVVGIAGEDIPEQVIMDTELSSVIVPKKVEDMGATTNSEIFGTFQLVCMEKGECETRNLIKLYPVTVINKCLRCPKFGATIV